MKHILIPCELGRRFSNFLMVILYCLSKADTLSIKLFASITPLALDSLTSHQLQRIGALQSVANDISQAREINDPLGSTH